MSVPDVELRLISPPALIAPPIFSVEEPERLVILSAAPPELSFEVAEAVNVVLISDAALTSIFFAASSAAV